MIEVVAEQVFDTAGNPVAALSLSSFVVAVPPQLPGDYNQNGSVNAADYIAWRRTLGASVDNYSGADGSGNGNIGQEDYGAWRAHFGQTLSGSGSSLVVANEQPIDQAAVTEGRSSVASQFAALIATHIIPVVAPLGATETGQVARLVFEAPRLASYKQIARPLVSFENHLSAAVQDDVLVAWIAARKRLVASDEVDTGMTTSDEYAWKGIDDQFDTVDAAIEELCVGRRTV